MLGDNRLVGDLDHILEHTRSLWDELRGERLFITGGTGFFGCWLLESLAWANDRLGLRLRAWVLTRHPDAFRCRAPHLAGHAVIELHVGDVRSFEFPAGSFSHVIHAATESSARLNAEQPLLMLDTIVAGTRHTLDFAVRCSAQCVLLTSSGAVYGRQPPELSHIPEDYAGGPDPLDAASAYAEGKRLAELLCAVYARQSGLKVKVARGFAFVGPYLPLDRHFAIGNFIADGLRGGPIRVLGDGTPYRSYMYAADLAIWLWTILLRGQAGHAYNVGCEEAVSIARLASMVAAAFQPACAVHIQQPVVPGRPAARYVPCTQRARQELGLQTTIALPEAIRRTIKWHL